LEKIKRNRAATTERMIAAFEHMVTEQGIEGISITALAEKANTSKVLFYRYFGNLEGFVEYYLKTGRVIPQLDPNLVAQIKPTQEKDLAAVWSTNVLQLFRSMRAKPVARALLKATVKEHDALATVTSNSLDSELTTLVHQLSFVKGSDHEAISAMVLGGLSYLTIQAQLDRSSLGLELRQEADWLRIEKAIKLIYLALAKMAIDSSAIKLDAAPVGVSFKEH
jgi:AcrR family transcriptional regulator